MLQIDKDYNQINIFKIPVLAQSILRLLTYEKPNSFAPISPGSNTNGQHCWRILTCLLAVGMHKHATNHEIGMSSTLFPRKHSHQGKMCKKKKQIKKTIKLELCKIKGILPTYQLAKIEKFFGFTVLQN